MRLLLLDWFLSILVIIFKYISIFATYLSLLSRMSSWLSISMLLALCPLTRGYLSLTIFFLLSIDGCFVKGGSNNFLVLLDITCTAGYYFLVLVDITCALWMTTHMIKWVRVCYYLDSCYGPERCMLNTWFEVKPIFMQTINTP